MQATDRPASTSLWSHAGLYVRIHPTNGTKKASQSSSPNERRRSSSLRRHVAVVRLSVHMLPAAAWKRALVRSLLTAAWFCPTTLRPGLRGALLPVQSACKTVQKTAGGASAGSRAADRRCSGAAGADNRDRRAWIALWARHASSTRTHSLVRLPDRDSLKPSSLLLSSSLSERSPLILACFCLVKLPVHADHDAGRCKHY